MRRLQILIEEELDAALASEAARQGTSKGALIRRFVAEKLRPSPRHEQDPFRKLIGSIDVDPEDIDDVVYGS